MAFCCRCGSELENGALFCVRCGQSVNGVVSSPRPVYPMNKQIPANKMSGISRLLCLLAAVPALAATLLLFIARIERYTYVWYDYNDYAYRSTYYNRIYGGPGTVVLIIGASLFVVFMFAIMIYGVIGKKNNVVKWVLLTPVAVALTMTIIGFITVNNEYGSYRSSYSYRYDSWSYSITWVGWLAFVLGTAAAGLYVISLLLGGSSSKAARPPVAVPAAPVTLDKPTPDDPATSVTPDKSAYDAPAEEAPVPDSNPDPQEEIERLREELRTMQQKISELEKNATSPEA